MKEYLIDDKIKNLYTIGEFASAVGRKSITIRKWEKDGIIPEASFRDGANRRLYTEAQILGIKDLVEEYVSQGQKISDSFRQKAKKVFVEGKKI